MSLVLHAGQESGAKQNHRHESVNALTKVLVLGRETYLHMFFQILRTLEALSAEITLMWLEGDMDSNM